MMGCELRVVGYGVRDAGCGRQPQLKQISTDSNRGWKPLPQYRKGQTAGRQMSLNLALQTDSKDN
jgi:hypothetical protein